MRTQLSMALSFVFVVSSGFAGCTGDEPAPQEPTPNPSVEPANDAGPTACSDSEPCTGGFVCDDTGACIAAPEVCTEGALGCACGTGCDTGLECSTDGLCQAVDCAAGTDGCPCFADSTCNRDPDGFPMVCDGASGNCRVHEDTSVSPGVPTLTCYTPCSEHLTMPDGTFRYCSAEGLMEGCIGELSCVDGSCIAEGETPNTCTEAVDCPNHQTCIDGLCLSNCEYNSDCAEDSACSERVCRLLCTASGGGCPPGNICQTVDGEDGVCLPQVPTDLGAPEVSGIPFELSKSNLTFTNNQVTGVVNLTNKSDRAETFLVRKIEHSEITADGRLRETELPLFWLDMGLAGEQTNGREVSIEVLPGETVPLLFSGAYNANLNRWDGRIEVSNPRLGTREITLDYSTQPDGQWSGSIHYFINFDDRLLGDWLTALESGSALEKTQKARVTQNALLVKWSEFRTNPLFTQRELDAMINATLSGSWEYASVHQACHEQFNSTTNAECYLYADGTPNETGIRIFTDNKNIRIPTGVMEMPLTIRLKNVGGDALSYGGRIESPWALQYPGNPPVALRFKEAPDSCEDAGAESCIVQLDSFQADILVGGRFLNDGSGCADASTFSNVETPWLVDNFNEGTVLTDDGRRVRQECRESSFPLDANASALNKQINASFAGANPIPDGRVRRRTVKMLDGIMVNNETIFMLVEERFDANLSSSMDPASFSAYGLVRLTRSGDDIDPVDGFTPGIVPDQMTLPEPTDKLVQGCSEDLVTELIGDSSAVLAGNEDKIAQIIMTGIPAGASPAAVPTNRVHYLCHETGRFDGGLSTWTAEGGEACPTGSGITFFLWKGSNINFADHECQGSVNDRCTGQECPADNRGTCGEVLKALKAADDPLAPELVLNPPYVCDDGAGAPDPNRVVCSDNRFDLKGQKLFFDPFDASLNAPVFEPIAQFIDNAFRYKTRFKSRTGKTIGFVPSVCELGGDALPYCYDPIAIEKARSKVDCLVSLYADDAITDTQLSDDVLTFLEGTFSFFNDGRDGFERLYSELLIMLGDEALTNAVASRFDLAGSAVATFEGDLLEPDGIRLSGGAGNEMLLLYRAQQHFQLVLDRFYRESPTLWAGLENGGRNFITLDSISTYFNRLILASTKKARAAGEIARRYQAFNRPDLARRVIERSYTEAYLESIAISQFMRRSVTVLQSNEVDALRFELKQAQRQYKQALLKMREGYRDITDELTFFGDPPDYIPFPAPGRFDVPSVRLMLDRALTTIGVAKEREERALSSNRAFDVDTAQFQAELARIGQQFENDLADLCGTFEGADGNIYPAISKYAGQSAVVQVLGEPCGFVGNGSIFEARSQIEARALDLRAEIQDIRDVFRRVDIEQSRVDDECNGRVKIAQVGFQTATSVMTIQSQTSVLNSQIASWERQLSVTDREVGIAQGAASIAGAVGGAAAGCAGVGAPLCAVSIASGAVAGIAFTSGVVLQGQALGTQRQANADIASKEADIRGLEQQIATLNRDADYQVAIMECCLDNVPAGQPIGDSCQSPGPLMVNAQAQIDNYMVELLRSEIEARRADVELQRAIGQLAGLRNRANRVTAQQEETEQHLINVEAARNDPNIRIYANADVLDADKSFRDALVDAFRATRMFEFYTAQSYAAKEDLFLVRMVGRGENNLEDYVLDLQRAFHDFENTYGRPDSRVEVISLRDDIFKIPKVDETGHALLPAERTALLRDRLNDPSLLDDRGYIRVPFSTTLAETSPLTAIHKINHIEAEIHGSDLGDRVGRIYLTSKGTSTIRSLNDEHLFHRMDPVTAVINPYFNGVRVFDPEIYQNDRLRDRPLVNSLWELTLNFRDEAANDDVNINSITDIRLYYFYEDFTEL